MATVKKDILAACQTLELLPQRKYISHALQNSGDVPLQSGVETLASASGKEDPPGEANREERVRRSWRFTYFRGRGEEKWVFP